MSEARTDPPVFPPQQRAASRVSLREKKYLFSLIFLRLFLLVAIAALAVLASGLAAWKFCCLFASIVAFAILAIVEGIIWATKPDKVWYDARALAESVKSLAWRYAAKDNTFAASDSQSADSQFLEKLKFAMEPYGASLLLSIKDEPSISAWMKATRNADFHTRRKTYHEHRLRNQIIWFSQKVETLNFVRGFWSGALIVIYIGGVIFALLEISGLLTVDVLGIVGALAASVLAWIQSKQHASIAHEYATIVKNLKFLSDDFERTDESKWSAFVNEVEDELAREHAAWQTQRRKPM